MPESMRLGERYLEIIPRTIASWFGGEVENDGGGGDELTSQAATLLLNMVGEVLGQDLDHGLSGVCVKYLNLLLS